jgi:two-component system, LuxR family, response regulator TtrR
MTNETVYVVDDDEAVRDSLRWLLEGQGFRVSAYDSAERFLGALPAGHTGPLSGCLIADVRMPGGMSGTELHDELLRRGIELPLVFITGHGSVPLAVNSMKKGAVDFLEKPFNDEQLCRLISSALEKVRDAGTKSVMAKRARELLTRLTPREEQVLDRIVAGRLNKQIADDLDISIKTVEAHRANIMDKIEARTMADLMKTALAARQA